MENKYKKYDEIVGCLFEVLLEMKERDGVIQIDGLELDQRTDKCILEVADMVETITTKEPIYLSMGRFEFFKNRILKRFKKFNVVRLKEHLPSKNQRANIIYQVSFKYSKKLFGDKSTDRKDFLIYMQIEDYLAEIYREYYSGEKNESSDN